jgi:Ca2+-transporting ATPase
MSSPRYRREKVVSAAHQADAAAARTGSGDVNEPAAPATAWHQRTTEETFAHLASNSRGLSAAEAARRLAHHGPNVLREAPPRSMLAMFAAQFADLMILILIAAAVISGVIGDLADTIVIAAIIVLNAILGLAQEYRAQRAMAALRAMAAPTATVLRENSPATIAAADLVPGDVVLLEQGRIVPADLRMINVASLRIDESALTGESVPVEKSIEALDGARLPVGDRSNIAHKGSIVTYGRGTGVVVATGMGTEFGRIAALLSEARAGQTPLQRRLMVFGQRLALVVILICAIVFATGWLRGEPALPMFLTALSLAVAAIPEALPAVVSIALALGARRMMAQQALIRRLPAVETLGSVTFICSDKTGTLTANEMRADRYFCDGEQSSSLGTSPPWEMLLRAMAISHDAVVDRDGRVVGDPTEAALLLAARGAGFERDAATERWPRVAEIPFDAERKCMTTVHCTEDGGYLSITKGAAEVVIDRSTLELRTPGTVACDRTHLLHIAHDMAADGLRLIAVAVRRWDSLPCPLQAEAVESKLEFVGLIGLIDPPRPEARAAIATCQAAGIVPIMITGDHPATARAVEGRLGLLTSDDAVLTGRELAELRGDQLEQRVSDLRVYARVAPEQKVKIVSALRARGEVVAMTGDGVNDAPALQCADIGVAMGVAGTDVAREASDMVLLDDNFATIVRAVREGRRIYDNLRRFVRYVLTTNSAEIWTIFLAPFLGLPIPLLPIQILWINLVTDGLPGIALASEPGERNVMQRPPRSPTESLFARGLGTHAFLVGLFMAALALASQAWYVHSDSSAWQTVVFTMLCFTQLGHVLAIRSEETSLLTLGFASNRPLFGAVLLTIAMQLAVVYLPVFNALFHTVPLGFGELCLCIVGGLAVILVVELEKWLRRGRSSAALSQQRSGERRS